MIRVLIAALPLLIAGGAAHADPVSILVSIAATEIAGTTIGALVVGFIINTAIGFILAPSAPDNAIPNLSGFDAEAAGRTQTVRQPLTSRRIIYGEVRVGGPIVFLESTGDNKFAHLVIALAGHEVDAIGAVWLDDFPIYDEDLDAGGLVNAGKYDGKVRIKKHLGTAAQTADADLIADTSATSNTRLRGIAYIYVRLEFDQDLFPTSLPNLSASVRGKKVYDPRDAATVWTPNAALVQRDYFTDTDYGLGAATAEFDDTFGNAAANTSDQFQTTADLATAVSAAIAGTGSPTEGGYLEFAGAVLKYQTGDRGRLTTTDTLPDPLALATDYYVIVRRQQSNEDRALAIELATSHANALAGVSIDLEDTGAGTHTFTKNAEPRYTANGVVLRDRRPFDIVNELLTASGGRATFAGGVWRLRAAASEASSFSFTQDHLVDKFTWRTKHSGSSRFNAVKGTYASPLNRGVPADYPAVVNATYVTEDNGAQKFNELKQPYASRPHQAQRIAKIALERHRQQITVTGLFSLHALSVQAGDVIDFTFARLGFAAKLFEVESWALQVIQVDDAPALVVAMTWREYSAAFADWLSGEETAVDPAPDTTLPSPFNVAAPLSFALTTESFLSDQGDPVPKILASWKQPSDFFIRQGGRIEVQFRRSNTYKSVVNASYQWEPSGSGTSEYYLVLAGSPADEDPLFLEPDGVRFNAAAATKAVIGSLAAGQWAYGDNDSLGFETIYVRLSDSTDPDSQAADFVDLKIWQPSFFVPGDATEAYIAPVENGIDYDVRIRALNHLRVRSAYTQLNGFTVGSTGGGASNLLDYGRFTEVALTNTDHGDFSGTADKQLDYGVFV